MCKEICAKPNCFVNAFRVAGECRRQVKNVTTFVINVKIVEFHDHIWNHYEKCIQISTNMPGIGSVNCEIAVKISEFEKANWILLSINQCLCSRGS